MYPYAPVLHGREGELEEALGFLEGGPVVMVVISHRGFVSSAFMRKVALDLFRGPLLWVDLSVAEEIRDRVTNLASEPGHAGPEGLREEGTLMRLDNYMEVDEGLKDQFTELVNMLDGGRSKLMVAMRPETPSYNRFYRREGVESGRVTELRLGG
ncbi:MAG: hypothetical protein ACLFUV_00570 [Methanomassiliicoccales archaeon]